jgi:hypothetical protein
MRMRAVIRLILIKPTYAHTHGKYLGFIQKSTRNPSTIPSNVPSAASAAYYYNALHPRQPAAETVYNATVPLAAFAAGNKATPRKTIQ